MDRIVGGWCMFAASLDAGQVDPSGRECGSLNCALGHGPMLVYGDVYLSLFLSAPPYACVVILCAGPKWCERSCCHEFMAGGTISIMTALFLRCEGGMWR